MVKTRFTMDDIENGDVSEAGSYSYISDATVFGMQDVHGPSSIETTLGNGLNLAMKTIDSAGVLYVQPSATGMPGIELFIRYE